MALVLIKDACGMLRHMFAANLVSSWVKVNGNIISLRFI